MSNTALFAEFTPSTKAEWLAKIEHDLKGRSIEDLNWQLNNQPTPLSISPFAHLADLETLPESLADNRAANTWAIGEHIYVKADFKAANQTVLAALMGGVNAPRFVFDDNFPSETQLETLLKDVELDYISVFFKEKTENKSPLAFLKNLKKQAEKSGKNAQILRGKPAWCGWCLT